MIGHAAKSGKYAYYVCGTAYRLGNTECGGTPVEKNLIEQSVMARILNVVLIEPNLLRLVEFTNKTLRSRAKSSKAESTVIVGEIANVRKRLGRLYDVIEKGELLMTDLAPRLRELRDREKTLVEDLQANHNSEAETHWKLVQTEDVLRYLVDLKGLLSSGTLSQRKSFLRTFVKAIRKRGNTIETEYTLPLPPEKSSLSVEGVPPTVSFGGGWFARTRTLRKLDNVSTNRASLRAVLEQHMNPPRGSAMSAALRHPGQHLFSSSLALGVEIQHSNARLFTSRYSDHRSRIFGSPLGNYQSVGSRAFEPTANHRCFCFRVTRENRLARLGVR